MARPGAGQDLRVVHLVNRWLPFSQSWIWAQTTDVPGVLSTVVARRTTRGVSGSFPHPHVISLKKRFSVRYPLALAKRPFTLRAVGSLAAELLAELGADVAHAHFGHFAWRYLEAVRAAGVPLVVSFYGYDVGRLPRRPVWQDRYRELFESVSVVLCEGPHMAMRVRQLGCPAEKVRLHELGADLGRCAYAPRTREREEPLRVLSAARFVEKKGLPDAVRAVGLAAAKVPHVPMELTIVGEPDGAAAGRREARRIRQAVRLSGLDGRVRIMKTLPFDALLGLARTHHVFLHPSRRAADGDCEGGAPVVIAELMATGMPVVATRHCDIPHLVEDGVTGLLADEGDIEGLSAHLARLAGADGLAVEMGRNGRKRACRLFDHEIRKRALAEVYREEAAGRFARRAAAGSRGP